MDNNGYKMAYEQVADKLSEKITQLYSQKIFPRDGKLFADILFTAATEGGALLRAMARLVDREKKVETANAALIQLCKASYVLDMMTVSGYYTPAESYQLASYISKVLDRLGELLTTAKNIDMNQRARRAVPFNGQTAPVSVSRAPFAGKGEDSHADEEGRVRLNAVITAVPSERDVTPHADIAAEEAQPVPEVSAVREVVPETMAQSLSEREATVPSAEDKDSISADVQKEAEGAADEVISAGDRQSAEDVVRNDGAVPAADEDGLDEMADADEVQSFLDEEDGFDDPAQTIK